MLVIGNYSVVQREGALETPCARSYRGKERVGLEMGTGQFRLAEVQGKCRLQTRVQCWQKPVVKAEAQECDFFCN